MGKNYQRTVDTNPSKDPKFCFVVLRLFSYQEIWNEVVESQTEGHFVIEKTGVLNSLDYKSTLTTQEQFRLREKEPPKYWSEMGLVSTFSLQMAPVIGLDSPLGDVTTT